MVKLLIYSVLQMIFRREFEIRKQKTLLSTIEASNRLLDSTREHFMIEI